MCFSANAGSHVCPDFQDFTQIFRYFVQIYDKSKLLEQRLHPLNRRLLHHYPKVNLWVELWENNYDDHLLLAVK